MFFPAADSVVDQFAPPGMSFAPPSVHDDPVLPPPPPPPASVPDDPTGEDVYLRRMALSHQPTPQPPPSESTVYSPPPPPPQAPSTASAPAPSISRAPVRYSLPAAPSELPSSEAELASALEREEEQQQQQQESANPSSFTSASAEEEPRSLRPGQKGFAQRLMSKYGWTKGTGLGADNSGILNPLSVKVEKQKKKPDAEGGGTVGPKGGLGRIVGGKRNATTAEEKAGKFGIMSEVVVLRGMVDGMDLAQEVNGGLVQEIGEECGEKYGRVERVYIYQPGGGLEAEKQPRVFIKFTSQLSALRVSLPRLETPIEFD